MTSTTTPIVRAKDVIHKEIVSINGMATAKEAAAKMRAEQIPCLIVEKRHADDAWGIIVVQDLIREVIIPGRSSVNVNVYEIMAKPVITVPADMDIRYVARLLYRAGIRRAPVEEQGELIGMVSLSSLILDNDLF
ncbi:MAG: CBS domain-containing protein [Desulfobacteraceae bacterium]|nr:CBS domain-containing protein [Desulfobacteraceae bacterium]MBC2758090.1 CBS domain-containing protein [Desulfobacteraceae bacterium]